MRNLLICLGIVLSSALVSQTSSEKFDLGGKSIIIPGGCSCQDEILIDCELYKIACKSIPKWICNIVGKETLLESLDEEFQKSAEILERRELQFKSFNNPFNAIMYKYKKEDRIVFMITSLGEIESVISLSILLPEYKLNFDDPQLPLDLVKLLEISDLH